MCITVSFHFTLFQGYEDWLRHKADNAINHCPVHFIQHGKLVRKQSRKLRVSNYDLTRFVSQILLHLLVHFTHKTSYADMYCDDAAFIAFND